MTTRKMTNGQTTI